MKLTPEFIAAAKRRMVLGAIHVNIDPKDEKRVVILRHDLTLTGMPLARFLELYGEKA